MYLSTLKSFPEVYVCDPKKTIEFCCKAATTPGSIINPQILRCYYIQYTEQQISKRYRIIEIRAWQLFNNFDHHSFQVT